MDVSASGAALEHDGDNGEESVPEGILCSHMGVANDSRGDCSIRCLCLCETRYSRLYVFEKSVCIL